MTFAGEERKQSGGRCSVCRARHAGRGGQKSSRRVDSNWEKVKSFLDRLGGVAERSNAAVSKTAVLHFAGFGSSRFVSVYTSKSALLGDGALSPPLPRFSLVSDPLAATWLPQTVSDQATGQMQDYGNGRSE